MKQRIVLIAAPTALSPGGYVKKAYEDRIHPQVDSAEIEIFRNRNGGSDIELTWLCPNPVRSIAGETDLFMDAAAILAPQNENSPLFTMGAAGGLGVEGAMWRAERDQFTMISSEGLGSVKRQKAPDDWQVDSSWSAGKWSLKCSFGKWEALEAQSKFALAIWLGASQDRGGLKSITPAWIDL